MGTQTTDAVVIGGGLAGCEAALQLAARGLGVELYEMRPKVKTAVHTGGNLAELVCSNSLKSLDATTAAGCLKHELGVLGSRLLAMAMECRVPAGGALAVDRDMFSSRVTHAIKAEKRIHLHRMEVDSIQAALAAYPNAQVIIATGPLTSDALSASIASALGTDNLAFYDAAAPIVEADSLDMDVLFAQSRYDKGGSADYLNAPFSHNEYDAFIDALLSAGRTIVRDFERKELFAACQPIEEVARTGRDALRFGALKPVGLVDPRTGERPWAAVQLRAENDPPTAYNLVGFQTNLTFPEQRRVFSMVPGLAHAEFSRYGVMHRNTFVDAPSVLDSTLAVRGFPRLRFAGQVCGTEGYCEAIASGLYAALCAYAAIQGIPAPSLPRDTVFGALLGYATDPATEGYQPMHVNYGILDPLNPPVKGKRERYAAYAARAAAAMDAYISTRPDLMPAGIKGAS